LTLKPIYPIFWKNLAGAERGAVNEHFLPKYNIFLAHAPRENYFLTKNS
jgi:hypothetical protein